jgi:hypothetical protein
VRVRHLVNNNPGIITQALQQDHFGR